MVDYDIRVDWNGDGVFDGVGDDITSRVLDRGTPLTIRYGRDQARMLSPLAPGRAQFEVDNTSRDYSPDNTSSPLAGNVRPGHDVRMQAALDGTTYGLLRAFLDDFEVLPDLEQRSVQLTCLDVLQQLKGVRVSTGLHQGLRTGQAIDVILDEADWPAGLRDLDLGATTIPWFWAESDDALTVLQQILDSEGPGALATVDIDGRLVFRDRHHRLLRPASTTAQATFRASGSEPCMSAMSYDHGWKNIVNSVGFSVPVRQPAVEQPVWTMQGIRSIANGQTALFTASASDPFVSAVAPVAGQDFRLLSGTVTTALSRTSGITVTVFVKATGGPAVIADLQLRAQPLQTQVTVQVQAEDSVSIGRYGRKSWSSDHDPVWACLPDAIAIADSILAHRAERLPTVTLTLQGGDAARLTQQLSRDLSDRVHIVEPETGLDADFWIEQIKHTISDLDHVTRFGCEKIPTPVGNPFRFDTTGKGFDDGVFGAITQDEPGTVFLFDHATQGKFDVGLFGT